MAEVDQSQLKGAFDSLLQYIDKPWKVAAIAFLGVLSFCGYFIYSNQALLIGAYQKNQTLPKMDYSRMDDAAQLLFKATGADLVAILDVDPIVGYRKVVRVYNKDMSRAKDMDGMKIPLFNGNKENNQDVIHLMAGEVPCSAYNYPQSELGFFYVGRLGPTAYMCRISVPPTPNEFIGQVTIGWKTQPKEDPVNYLTIAADMLTEKR